MYREDELLPLSALQHVLYCERQCAFIHVEQIWVPNQFTVRGDFFHARAHDGRREVRGTSVVSFGLEVRSLELGIVGVTDSVETEYVDRTFNRVVSATPIEYKSGRPKKGRFDEVQLCAQAMCLEEMLGVRVDTAALYYGKTRHRTLVRIDEDLREITRDASIRLHTLIREGCTPPPVYEKRKCETCSFFDICRPEAIQKQRSAAVFIEKQVSHVFLEDLT